MLEGLVAWVLNTYLGKYVNNLNTDQLSVALLKGAVELENLPLKKDALKELELPFEVKAGLIGKVTLQIPFYRPHVDPWNERQQKGESYWYSVTASVVTRIVENIELKIQDVHLRFEDGVTNPSHPFAFGICIKNVSVQNAVNEPVQKLMRKKQLDVAEFSVYWDVDCTLLGDLPQAELQEAMDQSMESRDHHYILEPVCASALLKRNCSKEPLRSRHTPRIECDIHLETIPLKLSQLQYRQIMEFLKELERKERQVKFRKWKPKVAVSKNCREWWCFALNANLHEIREQRKRWTWAFLLQRARDAVSYTDKYFTKLKGGLLSADDKEEICRIEEEQSFEELKILRELVHERFHKQEELAESLREPQFDSPGDSPADPDTGGGSGMLQYLQSWFPGWGGWYGQQSPEGKPVEGLTAEQQEQWTPKEILGSEEFFDPTADASCMNTYTKRDHVFAKLNLQLQRGTVTLLHQEQGAPQTSQSAFMQLEFSGVKLLAESLPRRNSSLLLVRLGGLFLRDLATEGTMFPLLVFPNPHKEVGRVSQSFGLQTSADGSDCYPAADPDDPVFEMLYERNPVHSHFERRLNVSTRPLNIIYNPQAIKKVADFFYKGKVHTSGFGYQSELELRVAEAARRQYNRLKMQTKAEIRQTLDRLLVGDFIEESKRWTVRLDISAPQVIFPDDFKFTNPVPVDDSKRKNGDGPASEENQFSDDEYKTPLATPPNTPPPETSSSNGEKTPPFSGVEFSEEQLQAHLMSSKMYERYSLSFMDLQIMVGRVKDNWKHIQDIDVGPTHVVEKFNVHLQLERRLIYTSDPKYPGAVLSGSLPDLKIHINEDKISALKNCFALLTTPEMKTFDTKIKEKIFPQGGQRGSLQDSVMNLTQSIVMLEQHTREVLVESQLLLAEFKVNCMQLGVESNGRYISVLKTYGADFDLLMASHKNLSFDIPTGSLRDSRAQSPVSGSNAAHFTNAATLNNRSATAVSLDRILTKEQESLIKLEYQFVSSECPSMNLDSTLQEKDDLSPQPLMTDFERSFREQGIYQSTYEQNTEVAVEIHRLNLLLLRTVGMANGEKYGRKIATASIGGTKVNDNAKNQYVVSIGNSTGYENIISDIGYFESVFVRMEDAALTEALSFTFVERAKQECFLNLSMASLHYNHSAKFLKELTLSMDELEENFRSMLKSAATKVTTVLATKTAEYSEMVSLFETPRKARDCFILEEDEIYGFGTAFHILNNTTIQFKLEKIPIERESELAFSLSPDDLATSSIMKIEGKFVNPVQVVLAKHVYEQVLQTLDNLVTCGEPSIERKENELQVQLSGDLTLGAQGLIALHSLLMEDLLEKNPDSKYKNLMVSRGAPKPSSLAQKEYLSQSCPSVSNVEYPDMPRSLPSHMEEAPNVFQLYQRPTSASRKKQKEVQDQDYPLTPPPSPTVDEPKILAGKSKFDDSLVHINIFLVDKKHPEFSSSYSQVNRSIDVDFNCLDVLITLQTWVVILDFFGIGSTADNHAMKVPPEDILQNMKSESSALLESELQDPINTKLDLKVHSLSLVLNKTTSELAKANVSKLVAHLEMIEGDLALQGSIGSLSLSDLTSHGEFYRERFTTSGEEALIFQTFKYGRPDPLLRREHDVRVSLQMASVQYVHTQRFQAEVVAFIQHFTQLQDVLGRQRAAIEGQTVRDQAQRCSRVLLDIEAGAPVLLIPESSRSNNLIVANLGKLKVKNKFLFAGFPGTFTLQDKFKTTVALVSYMMFGGVCAFSFPNWHSQTQYEENDKLRRPDRDPPRGAVHAASCWEDHVCLLDCIVVDLQDMDIFAAERHPREYSKASEDNSGDLIFPSYFVRQTGGSLLTEPCRLKLQVERNLDKEISHTVPDISIHGNLSSVHCSLDLYKYKLIRGLLENNLGEPIEEFMRPYDLQDPRIHTVLSGEVYTCMCFLIDMVNVSLELKDPKGKEGAGSLARFDFKKCKLLYESFSNQTKSVNLVSHSMMAFDTRSAGQKTSPGMTNVFTCIFQPSKNSSTAQGSIQIELHFRSTKDSSCFTVVLNNLRVFLIFDWLLLVHDFLHTPSDIKKQTKVTPSRHRNSGSESAVIPKTVKSGVVTKRSSLPVSTERHLEVKVNVTGTEFVVVEDVSCFDTNAIILKGTTVLTYKPRFVDRPFSGSLFGIEIYQVILVFSCRLGNEQDTALSIVDPVQIQVELVGNSSYQNSSGLMDAFNSEDFPPILEIQLQALDIRLSYNDVRLFLAIAKSIPEQANAAVPDAAALQATSSSSCLPDASRAGGEVREGARHTLDPVLDVTVEEGWLPGGLLSQILKGQLKKAASWLFKNAEPLRSLSPASSSRDSQGAAPAQWVSGVELRAESVCICFIDDCMDCDVPLAELTFSRLNFLQRVRTSPEGYAHFTLSGDYYNRALSGWEPFIEPWPCSVSWQQQAASRLHPPRLKLEAKAKHRLDINITSVLIGLPLVYLRTRSTASLTNLEHQIYARAEVKAPKRRQPFVPFALRNHTGCTLWFATLTTTPTRHTHDLRIHQLQVRVNGWEQVSPVSVDKVGTFFRYAAPDKNSSSSMFSSLPPVRVVFAVTMEGSARKVITVRSALIVKNRLETPMELRLDSPSAPDKPVVLPAVMPGDSFAVPLHLTSWRLQARPKGLGVFFCKAPIHWTNVVKTAEVSSSKRECHSMDTEKSRFFSAKQIFRQPGHTIYLLPTVVICNLLPCELDFYVKGMPINGTLKPGKEVALHTADTSQNIELGVSLENFPLCKELLIPPGTQNYMVRMRLYDINRRQLNLTIRIVCRAEGSLKIFISAPYWLINKTGLPLIFRQDNAKTDAAGQFEEHELARSLSPLLFCYADKEQPNLCTMRVGRGIHPEGMPGWCQGFSLDGGSGVRALRVIQQGNRPGLIYNIGIDVKKGRGRYIDTCMVIFAPRYLLDNKSSHKLAFAQREFARGQGTANPEGYISTLPGSSVVFHWPRNDYDQLLCVRLMDVPNCIWSGGFEVNKNNSFHINMRDTLGKCFFLRVEITLRGATYRISFSDTDQLPPPFRIDNYSKVPVVFTQHGVAEPRLRTEVKPMTSLDYAWDEPTLPPFITLTVKGAGSSEISCSMNDFQDNQQLYYENFIYIAATYTFSGLQEGTGRPVASNKAMTCAELVLDVSPKTQRVILKKKEPGKRSQLWRMTGTGMLAHEGSSVPHNPSKPSAARSTEGSPILDIAGLAAVTDNRYEPLMLRKPDRRRSTTQTWSFREGRLTCGLHGLVVQITDFSQRKSDRSSYEVDELPVTEQELQKLKNPDTEQELEVLVKLEGGIGLSLINKVPEELVFASLTGINVHYTQLATSHMLELSIQDVQVDNQLIGTTQPFMLYVTPLSNENEVIETGPAVQVNAVKFPSKSALTNIYKHLMVTAQRFTVQIEEKLLLKLLSFFGYDQAESEVEKYDESLHEKTVEQGGTPIRYYFENLKISIPQIKLSVFTSNKLPLDLKALKSTLGFPLIRFEDAVINLDPFTRVHPYETKEFIINDVLKHFQEVNISAQIIVLWVRSEPVKPLHIMKLLHGPTFSSHTSVLRVYEILL
ncbi:vacuolar protein sorting 13 D-like protein [Camelus ferus]|nr:vacuolar protein sorting 13 D-like protein [Camelus ferus]